MKRRLLSLTLVLVLLCSLTVPAAAAQSADERLASVTAQVKKTLGLNTEEYTEFYGDLAEEILAPSWYLEWSGEDGSLSISTTEEGKILSYRLYRNSTVSNSGTFAPSFPAGDQDSAKAAAQAFLNKVLSRGESVTMEARVVRLNTTTYRFGGEILLNGLPAGLTYSISVNCEDNAITSFSRDDINGRIMGGIPSATAKTTQQQARTALRGTLALRLEYVLPDGGSKQAVLRYLPEYGDEYYVDAATGKLVNLTELAREVEETGMAGGTTNDATKEESAAEAPEASLSKAEQQGADKLKGVLDRDALDAKARAISALGLSSYTLSSVDYTVARKSNENGDTDVTATLRYGRQVNGTSWRRTVTLDAKTGKLMNVYSSARMPNEPVERKVDTAAAQKAAIAFLTAQCGTQFGKSELYDSINALEHDTRISHSFTYAQKVNGYFFPGNMISVGVDATDGSISSYSNSFDDAVTFDSAAGILTMNQAIDAWLDTYEVQLAYIRVPAAIDYSKPEYKPLMDYGISYLYKLTLGYALNREDYLLGIDAKTGKAVAPDWGTTDEGLSYSDIAGHWAQSKIEKLAQFGVGYTGDKFSPNAALTQIDLIALLASTEGYTYDASSEDSADNLYNYAYQLGILTKSERNDKAVLTRAATVKLILNAVGYGPVAQLQGIYRTKFVDDGSIPADCYGYVALAQGLGMVSGNSFNRFLPNSNATRAQAAVMLYNLMDR